jgi:hypothetical protein
VFSVLTTVNLLLSTPVHIYIYIYIYIYGWAKVYISRSFATRMSHFKICHFWIICIERNVCRCTFNRYSVITQFEKLSYDNNNNNNNNNNPNVTSLTNQTLFTLRLVYVCSLITFWIFKWAIQHSKFIYLFIYGSINDAVSSSNV